MTKQPQPPLPPALIDQLPQHGKLTLVDDLGFAWVPNVACAEYIDRASYVYDRADGIRSRVEIVVRVSDAGRTNPADYCKTGAAPEIIAARQRAQELAAS